MISRDLLIRVIQKWDSENCSVSVLKGIFEAYGKTTDELTEDYDLWITISEIQWAEKYAELSFNTPFVEINNIIVIDHEGKCLCYDFNIITVGHAQLTFDNWITKQRKQNESK